MAGQAKSPFYFVLFLVVAGLLWMAWRQSDVLFPDVPKAQQGDQPPAIDPSELGPVENPQDTASVTTVKEYAIVPGERLPPVKGTSAYKPLQDNTVRFALNVWAGWGPIILANEGAMAGKVWKTTDGKEFKVELVLIDDPVAMRDAYAAGEVHIGWATLDMVPLFMEGFIEPGTNKPRDSRIMPRIFQQIDWSNGGDGIVVRSDIRSVSDLRGKKVALAKNSPSEYFVLNMLVAGGVQPSEVQFVYTPTAFEAAAAFNADKSISAAVSWAPDIYKLAEVQGNRMLVTTQDANKLIADVWFARADFAKDHPEIIESLVRGIFDGMQQLKQQDKKQLCARLMADMYGIPASDVINMFGDAHSTNWPENYQFFVNQNNPANFERVWRQAYYLYKQMGSITHQPVPFDQVMDFTYIQKLGKEEAYSSQKDEYIVKILPKSVTQLRAESEILTNTVVIHFYPNQDDPYFKITRQDGDQTVEELYDPSVDLVLDEVAGLVARFGGAQIVIEGHTDSSFRGTVPESLVKELSSRRANAVRASVLKRFPNLNPQQFSAAGYGWDVPADENDPDNQAKNRRVEIKVYSAEKQP
jgi:NitT/TauT family transport system substrate-binding protein